MDALQIGKKTSAGGRRRRRLRWFAVEPAFIHSGMNNKSYSDFCIIRSFVRSWRGMCCSREFSRAMCHTSRGQQQQRDNALIHTYIQTTLVCSLVWILGFFSFLHPRRLRSFLPSFLSLLILQVRYVQRDGTPSAYRHIVCRCLFF